MLHIVVWKTVYLYRKFRYYYYKFYVCTMKNGFIVIMTLFADTNNYLQIIDGKNEKSQKIGKHNLLQESHEY